MWTRAGWQVDRGQQESRVGTLGRRRRHLDRAIGWHPAPDFGFDARIDFEVFCEREHHVDGSIERLRAGHAATGLVAWLLPEVVQLVASFKVDGHHDA